ncbi:MAG: hypothetical protein ACR2NW_06895, partial [Thermodesulfobacteriota bacterium]
MGNAAGIGTGVNAKSRIAPLLGILISILSINPVKLKDAELPGPGPGSVETVVLLCVPSAKNAVIPAPPAVSISNRTDIISLIDGLKSILIKPPNAESSGSEASLSSLMIRT